MSGMWAMAMILGGILIVCGIAWFWIGSAGKGLILVAIGWVILGGSAFLRFTQRLKHKKS